MERRTEHGLSMARADAEDGAVMPCARPEGSGRKPREKGLGASNVTARPWPTRSEAEVRLMEEILGRENMMAALRRVVANKGAPGADGMPVEELRAYLVANWPRIKEELLAGRARARAARGG